MWISKKIISNEKSIKIQPGKRYFGGLLGFVSGMVY
jgi:hypothetical protein